MFAVPSSAMPERSSPSTQGAEDAGYLAREFEPVFSAEDFIGLPNHRMYLRLMIDGEPSKPFSVTALAPAAGQRLTR